MLFMIEEQSKPEEQMVFRVCGYVNNWYAHLSVVQDMETGLPLIIPVVVYTGRARWRAATRLRDLVAIPAGSTISAPLVDAQYILVDEKRLVKEGRLPMDNIFAPLLTSIHTDMAEDFYESYVETHNILHAAQHPESFIEKVEYLIEKSQNMNEVEWFKTDKLSGVEQMAKRGFPKWQEEFFQRGIEQGFEQGTERKSRDILLHLLTKRFGSLDAAVETRVEKASGPQLDAWLDRAISAPSLTEVFE